MTIRCLSAALALFTALALHPAQAAPIGVNLIGNGDAETGDTTAWQAFAGTPMFETRAYAAPLFLFPDAPHGTRLFAGAASAGLSAGWQTADVSSLAALIDAGNIGFNLTAYLGGISNEEDNTLLYVSFLDGAGSEIDHSELGPVFIDLRANLTVLGGFRTEGTVPGGTRAVQFSLSMDAPDGNSSGAYADNLGFALAVVPEPQSLALVGLALAGLAASRRRAR